MSASCFARHAARPSGLSDQSSEVAAFPGPETGVVALVLLTAFVRLERHGADLVRRASVHSVNGCFHRCVDHRRHHHLPTIATSAETLPPTTTTAPSPPPSSRAVLADISMTSVPPDVIVPTNEASLDEVTNPINGRRGGRRPLPDDLDCVTATPDAA